MASIADRGFISWNYYGNLSKSPWNCKEQRKATCRHAEKPPVISPYEMKRSRSSSLSPRPVSKAPTVQHISRARLWLFRLVAALGAPLLLCLLLELVLRIAGFGYSTGFFLRSEVKGQPVLEQNDKFAWRFFGPELARQPFPFVFRLTKNQALSESLFSVNRRPLVIRNLSLVCPDYSRFC